MSAPTVAYATSADGTRIGYARRGAGPGLVLVQGAVGTGYTYNDLALALASSFTVYTPDRRGRGLSPKPYVRAQHDIARDVEDVDAVLAATDASLVFGLSSGAIITLECARTLPRVKAVAVYEPPFYPNGMSHEGIARLNREIEHEQWSAAMVSTLLTTQLAPAPFRVLPRFITERLAGAFLSSNARQANVVPLGSNAGPATIELYATRPASLRDLLPSVRYDFHVVGGMDGHVNDMAAIDKPVLLVSGSRSQGFLKWATRTLRGLIPGAQHVEIAGVDHSGPWNKDAGGRPDLVAPKLREFLLKQV